MPLSPSQCCRVRAMNLRLCPLLALRAPTIHRHKAQAHRERFTGKAVKLNTTLARSLCGQILCPPGETRWQNLDRIALRLKANGRRQTMARYVLTKAFWSNQQRVRAGRILAQSQAEAQPGDFVWTGTLPDGAIPVGAVPPGTVFTGADSVDG